MRIFATDLLSPAEQQAMAIDGELYRLGSLFVPIGIPEVPAVRAAAVRGEHSARLIAARHTAAWVWGAEPVRPSTDQFVVDIAARWRPAAHERLSVIEAVLQEGETVDFGDGSVTTCLRTAIDICRFDEQLNAHDAEVVRQLGVIGGFTLSDCIDAVADRPRLAGKRATIDRLAACWDDQPELTR